MLLITLVVVIMLGVRPTLWLTVARGLCPASSPPTISCSLPPCPPRTAPVKWGPFGFTSSLPPSAAGVVSAKLRRGSDMGDVQSSFQAILIALLTGRKQVARGDSEGAGGAGGGRR